MGPIYFGVQHLLRHLHAVGVVLFKLICEFLKISQNLRRVTLWKQSSLYKIELSFRKNMGKKHKKHHKSEKSEKISADEGECPVLFWFSLLSQDTFQLSSLHSQCFSFELKLFSLYPTCLDQLILNIDSDKNILLVSSQVLARQNYKYFDSRRIPVRLSESDLT